MMFFFKKPEIVLDCFIEDAGIIQTMPVEKSNRFFPSWWKALPKSFTPEDQIFPSSTMKYCQGFIDYYANSITIPMWSDLIVKIRDDREYFWQYSDRNSTVDVHSSRQRGSYLPSDQYGHMKLISPWAFRTKEDINWVWSQPTWNFDSPESLIIPPAIINYKHQFTTNVNMLFRVDSPREIFIPFGQPLAHLTPMTEKNVVIKRHLVSKSELDEITSTQKLFSFLKKYKTAVDNKAKFSDCPFHKGVK